jgi:hypothetical protein
MPRIAAFTRASAGGPCAAERAIAKRGGRARERVWRPEARGGGEGREMHHWREPRAIPGRIAGRTARRRNRGRADQSDRRTGRARSVTS